MVQNGLKFDKTVQLYVIFVRQKMEVTHQNDGHDWS